jgi:two-component system, chemotaxis family, chemotaxis protein CheY
MFATSRWSGAADMLNFHEFGHACTDVPERGSTPANAAFLSPDIASAEDGDPIELTKPRPQTFASHDAAPRRILIVEDSDTTRRRLATLLRSNGYHVDEATDGRDALRKVSKTRYQAILLDLVLPHVDGWLFRETVLRHPEFATIPTVILTVQALRERDRYLLRTPFILQKPFEDLTVLSTVERACVPRAEPPSACRTRAVQEADEGLFWSRRGEIACALHAPSPDTSRWQEEGWSAIRRAHARIAYQCQHCSGTRPIVRARRSAS